MPGATAPMTDFETPPWDIDALEADEPAERDPDTDDMFGGPAPAADAPEPAPPLVAPLPAAPSLSADAPAYQVLARKYRPRTFEDLIGQEAMVRTLTNAFATGRIAHAFMLTGVRGVGKTTTARLMARALNYESDTVHGPSVDLTTEGRHCRAIIEGRHMDVLELDAASRTKVDEMRELLDSVRYAPVEARYKVYVIDEVHMLSTAAFNALLKTLEEPPAHAKFIFATTEIRKVPVTILSRCQRFDLRRVEPDVLGGHLSRVAGQEGASVEPDGMALIARAAEGSVRDGLSILDQAIVQAKPGVPVTAGEVRDMLGLADRGRTLSLFETVMRGDAGAAIALFRELYGYGADPGQVALDLLEHAHGAAIAKAIGADALGLPKDQAAVLAEVGGRASVASLSRVWQMLLKASDEVRRAPDPAAAVEMALIRLAYAAELPGPEEALKALQEGRAPVASPGAAPSSGGGGARAASGGGASTAYAQPQQQAQPQPRPQAPPQPEGPQTFAALVALIEEKRDAALKYDVEHWIRPIQFAAPRLTISLKVGAPEELPKRLAGKLKGWTGKPWFVEVRHDEPSQETVREREARVRGAELAEVEADPFVKALLAAFPGAQIVSVSTPGADASAGASSAAPVERDAGDDDAGGEREEGDPGYDPDYLNAEQD